MKAAGLALIAAAVLFAPVAEAYTFIGGKWQDPALPAPWRLNTFHNEPSIPGNEEFQELRDAMDAWQDLVGVGFTHQEGPEVTTNFPCGLQTDGQNVVSMRDCLNQCTGGCLGVTSTTLDFGVDYSAGDGFMRNIENDITYTRNVLWITQADAEQSCVGRFVLLGVGTHEAGHLVGLGHSPFGAATMFPSTGPCNLSWASLHPDDISGALNLYDTTGQEYQVATHDVNNVRLTVTNHGNVGVTGGAGVGLGFEFPVGLNHIFEGSLIFAAEGNTDVSDDYRIQNATTTLTQDADFLPLTDLSISTPGVQTDQETTAEWNDSVANRTGSVTTPTPASTPLGIRVTQRTFACADAPDDDYVILEYRLTNESGSTITDLNVGLIIDWDFNGVFANNSVDYDAVNRLGWVSDPSTPNRAGVRVLNAEGVRSYRALISSGAGSDVHDNTTKAAWLAGGFAVTNINNADIGMMIATGPFTIAPGGTAVAAFAIAAGTSLADLQANSQAADAKYSGLNATDAPEIASGVMGPTYTLHQNRPNPFRPSTDIAFSLGRTGEVSLRVFDIRGRAVRTLTNEVRGPGVHEVQWDGRDDRGVAVTSGVYFYELRVDGEVVRSRKMQLLR
jgi:hypothetical protein